MEFEKREFELWALGFNKDQQAVDFCAKIGTTAFGEVGRTFLCRKAETLTAEKLQEMFNPSIKKYEVATIKLQVEELNLTDQEVEAEGSNIYFERFVDLVEYDWSKDYNPDREYGLWVVGYNGDLILPLEEQIGEVATDKEEFLELMEEAKSMTAETLKEMFAKQIKESNITSLQLQVEERMWSDEDDCESEPIYEKFFNLEEN